MAGSPSSSTSPATAGTSSAHPCPDAHPAALAAPVGSAGWGGGEGDDEAGAAEGGVLDPDRAAVGGDDRPHHGQAEAAAVVAVAPGPGVVEAGEALEHPVAVRRRDPRPVVVDGEPHRRPGAPRLDIRLDADPDGRVG